MKIPNLNLFIPASILSIIGLVVVYSISPNNFNSQLIIFILGLFTFVTISQIDFSFFLAFSPYFYFLQIILLIITLVFGKLTRGSARWLSIGGLNYQASEFVKPFLILFLANLSEKINLAKITGFLKLLFVILIPILLTFFQPDLGSSIIIFLTGFYIILTSQSKKRFIILFLLILSITIPIFLKTLKPYQYQRIETFINPKADPLGASYNQIQAVIAAGSGQIFGKGLGQGTQSHLKFLPEKQTDFIFASLAEEFGFVGCILVLFLFFIILLHLIVLSIKSEKNVYKIVFSGSFFLLLLESSIHIGINLGILPVTGIPLPFLSVGGSNAITSWIILGICSSLSSEIKSNQSIYLS